MERAKDKKTLFLGIILLIFLLAIICAGLFTMNYKKENQNSWILQSFDDTVVLLNNGEVVEVFGDISIDTLPPEDIKHLENGISFLSKEEALIAVEDYDG